MCDCLPLVDNVLWTRMLQVGVDYYNLVTSQVLERVFLFYKYQASS